MYPLSPVKANVGRFVGDCAKTIFYRVILIDGSRIEIPVRVIEKPLRAVRVT